jgi:peptidoglycan/LPS O-acetylase OafA/YrhL
MFNYENKKNTILDMALSRNHLPALDGLRAVAILSVIAYHGTGTFGGGARLGVSLFFVISGFLITWLLLKEHSTTGDVSLKRFYFRRALRIFPAYYAFLLLIIAVKVLQKQPSIYDYILPSGLYYVNYYAIANGSHSALQHLWSLSVEEQFYLLWPLLFLGLAKLGIRYLIAGTVFIITAGLLWRYVSYIELGFGHSWIYRAFDTRFDNLAIGCLTAICLFQTRSREFIYKYAVSLLLVPFSILLLYSSQSSDLFGKYFDAFSYTAGFTVQGFALALLMVQFISFHQHWSISWISSRVAVYIGTISYPMYLYHEIAAGAADKVSGMILEKYDIVMGAAPIAFAGLVLTIISATCSYRFIEKPFLKLKDGRYGVGKK